MTADFAASESPLTVIDAACIDSPDDTALSEQNLRAEIAALFSQLRPEFKDLIERYLDRRLRQRIDPSDVLQSAYLDVHERLVRFLHERPMEVRPWLFFLAKMKTLETNQHHLASRKRSLRNETRDPAAIDCAHDVVSTPSQIVSRKETRQKLLRCIDQLPTRYRDVIRMRHIQNISNAEASELLDITPNAASKLYVRALHALQELMC